MEEHPNATLIRGLFAAFRETDIAAIQNVISDTTIWHFPGRKGLLQGAHQGHAGILKFLGGVSELTDGTFSLELEDDWGCVIAHWLCLADELLPN